MAARERAARALVGQEITGTCQGCGDEFTYIKGRGRLRKRCEPCRTQPGGFKERRCMCGATFTPTGGRHTRCDECRSAYLTNQTQTCLGCGVVFRRKRSGQTYCTRECAFEKRYPEPKALPMSLVYFNECRRCSRAFVARQKNSLICSDDCRKAEASHAAMMRARIGNRARECRGCGVLFTPLHGRRYVCSSACYRRKFKVKTIPRRIAIKVHRRDGWGCMHCGCDTPRDLRGTIDDNAPECDHIFPQSRGGTDAMSNLQTLCRLCNGLKSDMTMEEFVAAYPAPRRGGRARSLEPCAA